MEFEEEGQVGLGQLVVELSGQTLAYEPEETGHEVDRASTLGGQVLQLDFNSGGPLVFQHVHQLLSRSVFTAQLGAKLGVVRFEVGGSRCEEAAGHAVLLVVSRQGELQLSAQGGHSRQKKGSRHWLDHRVERLVSRLQTKR